MDVRQTQELKISGAPENAKLDDVVVISSDESVAVIEGNSIKTVAEGSVTLVAQSKDGKMKSNELKLTVVDQTKKAEAEAAEKKEKEENEAAAKKVDEAIAAIGEVTLDSKDAIDAVRKEYNALPAAGQKMVTRLDTLVTAESACKKKQEEANQAAAEQAQAQRQAQEQAAAQQKAAAEKANSGGIAKNPGATDTQGQQIYYTKNGKKYHYKNPCGNGNYYPCTMQEALNKGLGPCEKCVH